MLLAVMQMGVDEMQLPKHDFRTCCIDGYAMQGLRWFHHAICLKQAGNPETVELNGESRRGAVEQTADRCDQLQAGH